MLQGITRTDYIQDVGDDALHRPALYAHGGLMWASAPTTLKHLNLTFVFFECIIDYT